MKDKKQCKRVTLKKKYSIEKRVREHKRRLKKVASGSDFKKRFRRNEGGIPNSWPFKAEMLQEIQKKKERDAREKQEKKQRLREEQRQQRNGDNNNNSLPDEMAVEEPLLVDTQEYQNMADKAAVSGACFEDDNMGDEKSLKTQNLTGGFMRVLRNVVQKSDVLIQVLDARDPNGCRNVELERSIIGEGKKLILLLNKIDLVPKEVVASWLEHLRKSFPTLAFKSATFKSSRPVTHAKASHSALSESELALGSQVVGAPALITLLKNYSRTGSSNAKTAISVGIVGVPNVGKSSVINSLCRSSGAAKVGGEPGITKILQEINLDSKVKLIDCPGVVMGTSDSDPDIVLKNAVKITNVKNCIEVVEALLKKYSALQIMQLFKVPMFKNTSEFLGHIAKIRGKLSKGGCYDYEAAAQTVLVDWTSGKIQHYCLPPPEDVTEKDAIESGLISGPRIVSHFSEPMNID